MCRCAAAASWRSARTACSASTPPRSTPSARIAKIATVVLTRKTPLFWFAGVTVGLGLLFLFLLSTAVLLAKGVGSWGIRVPVMWGFAITNFVWWIGIGHAGTLISAILLLLNQSWRNSI